MNAVKFHRNKQFKGPYGEKEISTMNSYKVRNGSEVWLTFMEGTIFNYHRNLELDSRIRITSTQERWNRWNNISFILPRHFYFWLFAMVSFHVAFLNSSIRR